MKRVLVLVALLVVLLAAGLVAADIAFESTQVTTHAFPGPIDEIVVRSAAGDVAFVAGRGRGVRVRETQHYVLKQPTLERDVKDGVLTLEVRCKASFVTCFSDLRISVPPGIRLTVDADSGDVGARGIDVAEARLTSDSGDLRLELAGRQRLVRAQTDSADVDVVARDVRTVDARTDSGDVVVTTRAARDVTAQTDSGDVKLDGISRNDRADRSIEAHTDSGDVTLRGR